MQRPDFNDIVETALASLGGSPTSSEVEAAAMRLYESRQAANAASNVGIEAVQCSVSLASCSSRRSVTQKAKVYDRVKQAADALSEAVYNSSKQLGLSDVPSIELHARDCSNLYAGHEPEEVLSIADALSEAAVNASIASIRGPFLDLSLSEEFSKVDIIPDLLSRFKRLTPVLQVGTEQDPLSEDTLQALMFGLGIASSGLANDSIRVAMVVNGCDRRAYGRRVSPEIKGLSLAVSPNADITTALELGRQVAATCQTCYRLLDLELRSPAAPLLSQAVQVNSNVGGIQIVRRLDGFPVFGGQSNRVSLSGTFEPEELLRFVTSRLSSFCYGSKEAGLVFEVIPGQ
ncbi:DUF711 family protein [bacterium]|nr:DUF711 family protein [bacterium]